MFFEIVKINNFRGELTDNSAKKEALTIRVECTNTYGTSTDIVLDLAVHVQASANNRVGRRVGLSMVASVVMSFLVWTEFAFGSQRHRLGGLLPLEHSLGVRMPVPFLEQVGYTQCFLFQN